VIVVNYGNTVSLSLSGLNTHTTQTSDISLLSKIKSADDSQAQKNKDAKGPKKSEETGVLCPCGVATRVCLHTYVHLTHHADAFLHGFIYVVAVSLSIENQLFVLHGGCVSFHRESAVCFTWWLCLSP
jgi:hypothetical protein